MAGESRGNATWLTALLLAFAIAAGLLLRIGMLTRQGLWADEVFSLAIATGHSLEHPAAEADPGQGDFVEPGGLVAAADLQHYFLHDDPPARPGRVVRAVLLSDTSPPLYYLLLNFWSRLFGVSDLDLRAFSLLWAMAVLPMIWLVGRRIAAPPAGALAVVLFSFAPLAVFYATEGRMYSMVWFLSLFLVWTTLALGTASKRGRLSLLWGIVGGAGLLTHYFYGFVWLACAGWLWLHPKHRRLAVAATATGSSVLIAAAWYRRLPESLGRWRVTGGWLDEPLAPLDILCAPFKMLWTFVSGGVAWKTWAPISSPFAWDPYVGVVLVVIAAGIAVTSRTHLRPILAGDAGLVWSCFGATLLGPVAFDLWRGTSASLIQRYALAGLPALLILLAAGLTLLTAPWRQLLFAALLVAWIPANNALYSMESRSGPPFRELGDALSLWATSSKLVLVQSVPSGLLGIARYMDPGIRLASWIEQLGGREMPEDLEALLQGQDEVALLEVHSIDAPARPRQWLEAHWRYTWSSPGAYTFAPACGVVYGECVP